MIYWLEANDLVSNLNRFRLFKQHMPYPSYRDIETCDPEPTGKCYDGTLGGIANVSTASFVEFEIFLSRKTIQSNMSYLLGVSKKLMENIEPYAKSRN